MAADFAVGLALDDLRGDVLGADVQGLGPGHLEGQLACQPFEVVGLGDEVGFAVDLDEDADLGGHAADGVDVCLDHALVGGAAGLVLGRGRTRLAEAVLGALEVAVAVDQRPLAVHHPGPGRLPELHHESRWNLSHQDPSAGAGMGSALAPVAPATGSAASTAALASSTVRWTTAFG